MTMTRVYLMFSLCALGLSASASADPLLPPQAWYSYGGDTQVVYMRCCEDGCGNDPIAPCAELDFKNDSYGEASSDFFALPALPAWREISNDGYSGYPAALWHAATLFYPPEGEPCWERSLTYSEKAIRANSSASARFSWLSMISNVSASGIGAGPDNPMYCDLSIPLCSSLPDDLGAATNSYARMGAKLKGSMKVFKKLPPTEVEPVPGPGLGSDDGSPRGVIGGNTPPDLGGGAGTVSASGTIVLRWAVPGPSVADFCGQFGGFGGMNEGTTFAYGRVRDHESGGGLYDLQFWATQYANGVGVERRLNDGPVTAIFYPWASGECQIPVRFTGPQGSHLHYYFETCIAVDAQSFTNRLAATDASVTVEWSAMSLNGLSAYR